MRNARMSPRTMRGYVRRSGAMRHVVLVVLVALVVPGAIGRVFLAFLVVECRSTRSPAHFVFFFSARASLGEIHRASFGRSSQRVPQLKLFLFLVPLLFYLLSSCGYGMVSPPLVLLRCNVKKKSLFGFQGNPFVIVWVRSGKRSKGRRGVVVSPRAKHMEKAGGVW